MYQKRKAGKLIVIDGADGAGKETTAKALVEKINSSDMLGRRKVHFVSFPDYSGPFGSILKNLYLSGRLGEIAETEPLVPSIMYAADRASLLSKMYSILNRGEWIVCDRYVQSNFAYQGVRYDSEKEREEFIRLMHEIEYEHIGLPQPDKTIILSLPEDIRAKRSKERGEEDINEKNVDLMVKVASEYLRLADIFNWTVVDCAPEGEQLSPDALTNIVWQEIFDEQGIALNSGA